MSLLAGRAGGGDRVGIALDYIKNVTELLHAYRMSALSPATTARVKIIKNPYFSKPFPAKKRVFRGHSRTSHPANDETSLHESRIAPLWCKSEHQNRSCTDSRHLNRAFSIDSALTIRPAPPNRGRIRRHGTKVALHTLARRQRLIQIGWT
jgi:hypothetical protein